MGFCFQTPAHECSGLPPRSSDMDHIALAIWKHVELSTTGGFRPGAPSLFCFFVSVVTLRFLRFFDFSNTSLSPRVKKILYDVISTATGSCWSINNYCPIQNVGPKSPADNDFLPGFSAKLMSKDLKLAVNAAVQTNSNIEFGKKAEEMFYGFTTYNIPFEAMQFGCDQETQIQEN